MMKSVLIQKALLAASLISLAACGDGKSAGGPQSDLEAVEEKGSEKFNLAKFFRENPKTQALKNAIAAGDAYIFFGDKNKFRLETNLSLDTQGEKGYFMGGPRGITAAYWLDGYVFGKKIGSGDRGFLVDLGAVGDMETTTLEAHIRFLGQDKYRGKVKDVLEQTFMRDLNLDTVFYPVPLLGLKVGGNIGGELGLRAELGVKTPETMSMIFRPKTSLHGGLSGSIEMLKFLSAKISGLVNVLHFDLASTADLGYLKQASYSYGHTGVDGGELKALDGKVEIMAKAAVQGVLPGGIDAKLWEKLLHAVGVEKTEWEWKHTVWNPEPMVERDLPTYGNSFMKYTKIPDSLLDCKAKAGLVNSSLAAHAELVKKHSASLKGTDAQMAAASLKYLAEIGVKAAEFCKQY